MNGDREHTGGGATPAMAEAQRAADAAWDAPVRSVPSDADRESLDISIAGFSGPLDLLLALARTQKVDLREISVVELADQYLAHIEEAKRLRLALAADFLVMAAWLTFLKSRLLLPQKPEAPETASAEDVARRLAFRLARLAAMREAARSLMSRHRLGVHVFGRGAPPVVETVTEAVVRVDLFDLLAAYGRQRSRARPTAHVVKRRVVWSVKDGRRRLQTVIAKRRPGEWVQLDLFLDAWADDAEQARTALAATFGASLEMAREGALELRQDQAFAPIFMRRAPVDRAKPDRAS